MVQTGGIGMYLPNYQIRKGAATLLVTPGCSKKCTFCTMYPGPVNTTPRSMEEIAQDIVRMNDIRNRYAAYKEVHPNLDQMTPVKPAGEKTHFFLQDGDPLAAGKDYIIGVLGMLRDQFEDDMGDVGIYVTTDATVDFTHEDYVELREAGLTRFHTGPETGDQYTLDEYIRGKGTTVEDMIRVGAAVREAGIKQVMYFITGMGGVLRTNQHIDGALRIIEQAQPDIISNKTLSISPESGLEVLMRGEKIDFQKMNPVQEVEEQIKFMKGIMGLNLPDSRYANDNGNNVVYTPEFDPNLLGSFYIDCLKKILESGSDVGEISVNADLMRLVAENAANSGWASFDLNFEDALSQLSGTDWWPKRRDLLVANPSDKQRELAEFKNRIV